MQTINANSTGSIACQLQASFGTVERAIARLKLEPVMVLDNVRHYSDAQVDRIRKHIQESKQ